MFVADLPPDVPPAFIQSICDDRVVNLNKINYKDLTVKKLIEISSGAKKSKVQKEKNLRLKIISKIGFGFGAQGGYYQRVGDIKVFLKKYEDKFDSVFNFQALMLSGGRVVAPVIGSARNTYNQEDSDSVRTTMMNYSIIEQARFSPVAPDWRNYLYFSQGSKPRIPDSAVIPKNKIEKDAWEDAIGSGWSSGVCQANKGYSLNIAKLRRDYLGMVRYHLLLKRGIVSRPFVAKTKQTIVGNKKGIKIGDQLLRITIKPGFNLNSKDWDAVIQGDPFYGRIDNANTHVSSFKLKSDQLTNRSSDISKSKPIVHHITKKIPMKKKYDSNVNTSEYIINYGNGMKDSTVVKYFNTSDR